MAHACLRDLHQSDGIIAVKKVTAVTVCTIGEFEYEYIIQNKQIMCSLQIQIQGGFFSRGTQVGGFTFMQANRGSW